VDSNLLRMKRESIATNLLQNPTGTRSYGNIRSVRTRTVCGFERELRGEFGNNGGEFGTVRARIQVNRFESERERASRCLISVNGR
jgi:hypothetical protein